MTRVITYSGPISTLHKAVKLKKSFEKMKYCVTIWKAPHGYYLRSVKEKI